MEIDTRGNESLKFEMVGFFQILWHSIMDRTTFKTGWGNLFYRWNISEVAMEGPYPLGQICGVVFFGEAEERERDILCLSIMVLVTFGDFSFVPFGFLFRIFHLYSFIFLLAPSFCHFYCCLFLNLIISFFDVS